MPAGVRGGLHDALVALLSLLVAVPVVLGHGYVSRPLSRNKLASERSYDESPNYCPHCLNLGGRRTSGLVYPETVESATSHGLCGDAPSGGPECWEGGDCPTQDHMPGGVYYTSDGIGGAVQASYAEGEVMEVEVVITAHHRGFYELRLCDEARVTQECLNKYPPLERVRMEDDYTYSAQPIDPAAPHKFFLNPVCAFPQDGSAGGYKMTGYFKLPDGVHCERCVLQWWWITGNSCVPPGYRDFDFPSEWDSCGGDGGPGWYTDNQGDCEGTTASEEFWNCMDISILPGSPTAPTPSQTEAPTVPTAAPTHGPTPAPTTASPTPPPATPPPTPAAPTAAPTTAAPTAQPGDGYVAPTFENALGASLWFYFVQRAGQGPEEVTWRGDCYMEDGQADSLDLSGGWFDAGDHVKFMLPMSYSATALAWGGISYTNAYHQTGQWAVLLDHLKFVTEFFLKAWDPVTQTLVGQVGNGGIDHALWTPCEVNSESRPVYFITPSCPGTEVAAEMAAALASSAIAFRKLDGSSESAAYANQLITAAEELYSFADTYRGKYSDCVTDAQSYYNSWSGYMDELAWGAIWLYKATGLKSYLDTAIARYDELGRDEFIWTIAWDDKSYGAAQLLLEITGAAKYDNHVKANLDHWINNVGTTPAGLKVLDTWGSLRYASNAAFLALKYAEYKQDLNGVYGQLAQSQLNYILGDNPQGRTYVSGLGDLFPVNPHHRTASGAWNNNVDCCPVENRHVLYGALVGGPPQACCDDSYNDERNDYITNEVATDYNALFTGACAGMLQLYLGGGEYPVAIPTEQPDGEFGLAASVNSQGTSHLEVKVVLEQKTAWPARRVALAYRYYADFSDVLAAGLDPLVAITISTAYLQFNPEVTGPFLLEGSVYYFQVAWSAEDAPYPGKNGGGYKAETQIRMSVSAMSGWNRTSDPSYSAIQGGYTTIPIFEGNELAFGQIPDCGETGCAPVVITQAPTPVPAPTTAPVPTQAPAPTQSPPIGVPGYYCGWNNCQSRGGEWCDGTVDRCTGTCGGEWCYGGTPAPITAPPVATNAPTMSPTPSPEPTTAPPVATDAPTVSPTPSPEPTTAPPVVTNTPTAAPTMSPTQSPEPTTAPPVITDAPTAAPTSNPTEAPPAAQPFCGWNGCIHPGTIDYDGWCSQSQSNCGSCNGGWCTGMEASQPPVAGCDTMAGFYQSCLGDGVCCETGSTCVGNEWHKQCQPGGKRLRTMML